MKANVDELLLDEGPVIQIMARMANEFREIRASDDHGSLQWALSRADAPVEALLANIQSIIATGGRQNTAANRHIVSSDTWNREMLRLAPTGQEQPRFKCEIRRANKESWEKRWTAYLNSNPRRRTTPPALLADER
jgi:hypothetical protein